VLGRGATRRGVGRHVTDGEDADLHHGVASLLTS
jgi:hypothetical protein